MYSYFSKHFANINIAVNISHIYSFLRSLRTRQSAGVREEKTEGGRGEKEPEREAEKERRKEGPNAQGQDVPKEKRAPGRRTRQAPQLWSATAGSTGLGADQPLLPLPPCG